MARVEIPVRVIRTARRPEVSKTTQMKFRLSRRLHDLIEEAGMRNHWGASEEIRLRLEASFAQSPTASADPWFADLLTAINQAAAGAANLKKHPPFPVGVMEHDGTRDVGDRGQDTTAYETFVEAVNMLMTALAPEGGATVSTETRRRLANQLAALALGALGERGVAAFAKLAHVDKGVMGLSSGRAIVEIARPAIEKANHDDL